MEKGIDVLSNSGENGLKVGKQAAEYLEELRLNS